MDVKIAHVKQGTLLGKRCKTIYGRFYVAFLAVPYAAPPIGNFRFMDPHPPDSWEGIRHCQTHKNNCCIQKIIWPRSKIIGNEDCLYLNIYAPFMIKRAKGLAVMVWIHGGQYMSGSGNFYNAQPDYLMERDIILVTVNYRLGAFGFLNLNHRLASGNQGLKDQVAALLWIKENIAAFGGDPNNITLFGSNVGAIYVHLLMLSPLSKDLFHKAILQGDVVTMNWTEDDVTIEHSYRLASVLGENSSNPENIIASLNRVSDIDIINAQCDMLTAKEIELGRQIFAPSIDKCSKRPFLPCSPCELLHNGYQKPVILGYTSLEYMRFPNECTQEKLQRLYTAIPLYTRTLLPPGVPQELTEEIGRLFQRLYFNNNPPATLCSLPTVLRCYRDIFNIPIKRIADARTVLAEAPTYVYEFSYVSNHKIVDKNLYCCNVHLPVTSQNDDVAYLFFLPSFKDVDSIVPPSLGSDDFKMIQVMTRMWTNFAQTGDPTPFINKYIPIKWKPAKSENFYYLDIDKELRLLTVTDCCCELRNELRRITNSSITNVEQYIDTHIKN